MRRKSDDKQPIRSFAQRAPPTLSTSPLFVDECLVRRQVFNMARFSQFPRNSLRWRLPFLVCALIGVVLVTFLWAAHEAVEVSVVQAANERAQVVADQVASLLDGQRTVEQARVIAADPDLRRFLQAPTDENRQAAQDRLTTAVGGTALRRIELWDEAGSRVLDVSRPLGDDGGRAQRVLPPASPPFTVGISALQQSGNIAYTDTVAEIIEPDDSSGRTGGTTRLGLIVIRSTFNENPPGIFSRLVGSDAVLRVGNRSGPVWTDFAVAVPAAPVNLSRTGPSQYRREDGEMRLGAVSHVRDTPWAVWVEFPLATIVAPANSFLNRMVPVAAVFLVVAAVVVALVSVRMTRPLRELSAAAEAIAAGEYSQRVSAHRRDEIGRLGVAFNAMSDEVQGTHQRLEARVAQRTAELDEARIAADRANRAKSDFLSRMSHELRTPLNAIMGFAQVLQLDSMSAEQVDSVNHILRGGRHLLGLINEVLDVTRIESGALSLSPEPVGVQDMIEQAVGLLRPLAMQRGIAITVDPSTSYVVADRQRLNQILFNLLSNAVKYNREGGSVHVTSRRTDSNQVEITVTDTGAGIPTQKLDLLFTPFERLGAETSGIEGTGLGLALARGLAQAMNGTLGVSSVVDEGTSFCLALPATEAPAAPAESPVEPTSAATEAAGTILYIEDNISNVVLMQRLISRRQGVKLVHARDGREGIQLVLALRPQLVFLDVHLPDYPGDEVLRQIWENPLTRATPVVVLTADATPAQKRRLLSSGAIAYLTKPFDIGEVLKIVDETLETVPLETADQTPR